MKKFFVKTLEPIAAELKEKKVDYPLTILFYLLNGVDLHLNS